MFIKAWAYICFNLQNPTTPTLTPSLPHHLSPIFDRSLIRDPFGLAELYANQWMNHNGSNNQSLKVWESLTAAPSDELKGLFELTPSQIQKLKQYGNSKVKVVVHLSIFSVTCAYVLACWVKANQVKEENVDGGKGQNKYNNLAKSYNAAEIQSPFLRESARSTKQIEQK
ncbi:hypothetical protein V8G54_012849 [Vigna mungo]|uniref:Uncharacterized protein n=1 Tax=Vigna mungo TaxID=3915 RepID=A0AAQ3NTN8_VIGMU